ncbi:MAG: glycosyltransferase family 2 protein [Polyangiaceae bacterium]|nr:glycosyltransferase family 2 protein [Polyangiaceae bacterium]
MLDEMRVAVVVPAFNEMEQIEATLAGIPDWVDQIWVVDDGSCDATVMLATRSGDPRVRVHRHAVNQGVGRAIATGYLAAVTEGAEVVAVMAGDNQMDPTDLARVVEPVLRGEADYVKGNRFAHAERRRMPAARRLAGYGLAHVTRFATGLRIDDPQCGYTAIAASAVRRLDLDDLWPRFGYPNDLLALLAAARLRVVEIPVRPVYADERSGVRPWHVLVITGLLARRFVQRVARRAHGQGDLAGSTGEIRWRRTPGSG